MEVVPTTNAASRTDLITTSVLASVRAPASRAAPPMVAVACAMVLAQRVSFAAMAYAPAGRDVPQRELVEDPMDAAVPAMSEFAREASSATTECANACLGAILRMLAAVPTVVEECVPLERVPRASSVAPASAGALRYATRATLAAVRTLAEALAPWACVRLANSVAAEYADALLHAARVTPAAVPTVAVERAAPERAEQGSSVAEACVNACPRAQRRPLVEHQTVAAEPVEVAAVPQDKPAIQGRAFLPCARPLAAAVKYVVAVAVGLCARQATCYAAATRVAAPTKPASQGAASPARGDQRRIAEIVALGRLKADPSMTASASAVRSRNAAASVEVACAVTESARRRSPVPTPITLRRAARSTTFWRAGW